METWEAIRGEHDKDVKKNLQKYVRIMQMDLQIFRHTRGKYMRTINEDIV